ncbi:hypothetical protein JB92DRAFT_2848733 [Gautieria morchelliformis]|nr:hypothetical protein JB92DRAFT_2848733 [Gautieria morchelliformis]
MTIQPTVRAASQAHTWHRPGTVPITDLHLPQYRLINPTRARGPIDAPRPPPSVD